MIGLQDGHLDWVFEPVCTIVRALSLDPSTAIAADLEACDACLRCVKCVAQGRPDDVYSRDAAVSSHPSRSHGCLYVGADI